ncbi:DUF1707 and DUF2154 domain-containing protein [Actinomadura alba]|uniref:DUF1707 and DUF2154 domain-containing protein n=1 Tax=Actinomadura alba TaxID=406431 RepID=A0ABR7LZV4_9ACTN|nr:DUF1707 and DUF2154 domain-containing protein [Actinomadura alba]
MRASDAERENTVERLRVASVEGRLTLADLTERTEAAYSAVTRAELETITADLPATRAPAGAAVPQVAQVPQEQRRSVAVLGDSKQRIVGRVDDPLSAVAVLGDVVLDLRGAHVTDGEVDVTATAILGNVKIIVPDGVEVLLSGVAVLGDKKIKVRKPPPGRSVPVVRVTAKAILGDVVVIDDEHTQPVRKALVSWLNRDRDRRLG